MQSIADAAPVPKLKKYPIIRWLTITNHKDIGLLYIVTALIFFLVGGVEAMLIRIQLGSPIIHSSPRKPITRSLPCMEQR